MLSRHTIWLNAFCISITIAAVTHAADFVKRKSAPQVGGTITGATKTELTVKPSTGDPITVPANEVASVDWDDAPRDMNLAKGDENNSRFQASLEKLAKVLDQVKSGNDLVRADVEFLIARVTARAALTDDSQLDNAIAKLNAFLKSNGDSFRYYDALQWLGQVYLAKEDFASARSTFEKLAEAPWSDYQLLGKVNLGRVLMGELKNEDAAQAFDAAIAAAGSSAADQSRKFEAMVGKARCLIALNKQPEALAVLTDVVEKGNPDDTALMAEAYVLQGNCLQAEDKAKEAVLAYLHVDVLFARESAYHAEALYHLTKLWKAVQHPDRAAEAASKLEASYPKSDWTKKLGAPATKSE